MKPTLGKVNFRLVSKILRSLLLNWDKSEIIVLSSTQLRTKWLDDILTLDLDLGHVINLLQCCNKSGSFLWSVLWFLHKTHLWSCHFWIYIILQNSDTVCVITMHKDDSLSLSLPGLMTETLYYQLIQSVAAPVVTGTRKRSHLSCSNFPASASDELQNRL